jgi:DNA polymerase-3 subunit alpha (Gram-positive type)
MKDKFKLSDIITSRDTIMQYLISKGIDNGTAFHVMEDVRKGIKYTKDKPSNIKSEYLPTLEQHGVPL